MWFKALTTFILIIIKLVHLIPLLQKSLYKSPLGRSLIADTDPISSANSVLNAVDRLTAGLNFTGAGQMDLLEALSAALEATAQSNATEIAVINGSRADLDEEEECVGFINAFEDLGLMTFIIDVFIQILALILLIFAFVPQIYSYFSAYVIAFPSLVLYVLQDVVGDRVEDFIDLVGIGDTMFDVGINLPSNDLINLAAGFVEFLSVVNIIFETLGTFPNFLRFFFLKFFALNAEVYFEGYGCSLEEDKLNLIDLIKPKAKNLISGWLAG